MSAPASVQAHAKQLFQSLLQLLWSFLVPRSVPLQTLLRFGDAENCVLPWQRGCSEGLCQQQNVPLCLLLRSPPKDTQHLVGFFCCCCTLSWWVWTASDDSKVSFLIYECHVQVQHHLSIVDIHFLWMHSSRLKLTCQLYVHSLAFVRPFWSSSALAQHLVTQKDLNFCFCWLCCLSFGASQEICSLLEMSLLIWNILHDVP